jgi:hypothetical protein
MGTVFTMFDAVWLVEHWHAEREQLVEQLAYCKNFACAEAAYNAAITAMPLERIILRQGMRVMRERPASKWRDLSRAAGSP